MIVKPFEVEKHKVKRLFVFGCSFTNFFWPTWANIVKKELGSVHYYNFGITGLGNLGILCKLSEASIRFQFSENDLIMVMWSTFLREDRWMTENGWVARGNVYNNDFYDDNFIKKYSDVCGYVIRDLALINTGNAHLQSLPSQCVSMPSVPVNYIENYYDHDTSIRDRVINLYKPMYERMPKSLFEHVQVDNIWPIGHSYYCGAFDLHKDPHPTPLKYYSYINENIMKLSHETYEYVTETETKLKSMSDKQDICNYFEHDRKEYMLF
jgi:hypothetical protein